MAALVFCAVSFVQELCDLVAVVRTGFDLQRTLNYLRARRQNRLFYQNCREVWLSELEKCAETPQLSDKVREVLSALPNVIRCKPSIRFLCATRSYFMSIEKMQKTSIDFAAIDASAEAFEASEMIGLRRQTGVDVADFIDMERRNFEIMENYDDIEVINGQEINSSFYEYVDTFPVYESELPTLSEGFSLTLTGNILHNCERFSINLIDVSGDVALHINPRLPQSYIVRNTKIKDVWGREEVASSLPFSLQRGKKFTIQLLVTVENYMISVNGCHFAKYYHRLPYQNIARVEVKGDVADVQMTHCYVKTYPAELLESAVDKIPIKTARHLIEAAFNDNVAEELDLEENVESEYTNEHPQFFRTLSVAQVFALQKRERVLPYIGSMPKGSIGYGTRLVIEGRIKLLPHSFYINLQQGRQHWPHPPIAFHFNPRFSKQSGAVGKAIVCRNAWFQGQWAEEERSELDVDLRPGKAFCLSICCAVNAFKVYVNNKFITKFRFRFEPNNVDTVYIQGDIKLWKVYLERPPLPKSDSVQSKAVTVEKDQKPVYNMEL